MLLHGTGNDRGSSPTGAGSWSGAAWRGARRFPTTLTLLAALTLGALATGSAVSPLAPELLSRLGFSPSDLWSRDFPRIVTSIAFTWGGLSFYGVLLLTAVCVGLAEWRLRSRGAAETFLVSHLAASLVESLLVALPFLWLGAPWAESFARAADVGPSAGCFGCVGGAVAALPRRAAIPVAIMLALTSFAVATYDPVVPVPFMTRMVSSVAHPIAALCGYAWVRLRRPDLSSRKIREARRP
ncbi:MAG: hypothetical protein PHU25_10920 [Deltaproteobacteria bacterium]|nr:hypothetical protein [Deltaproteobacteria bacterium]